MSELFGKTLTASEYKLWEGLLSDYTDAACVWAFENWSRNGKFFPKPAEILELIHAFGSAPENQVKLCGRCNDGWVICNPNAKPSDYVMRRCECVEAAIGASKIPVHRCSAECQRQHGKGYNENDIAWLFKKILANAGKFKDSMLDELDKERNGPPQWRQVGGVAAHDYHGESISDEDVPF